MAEDVTKRGVADLGAEVWQEHQKTVERFWHALLLYFSHMDVRGLKIYQDGMVAEGEIGIKIVEEGVRLGSKNYELINSFLKQGAILIKTENFNLVKEERDRLFTMTQAKSTLRKIAACIKYNLIKDKLLKKRDQFIAQQINETLKIQEKGILFIGAFHNVKRWLSKDILVKEIKDIRKIREYYRLFPFYNKHRKKVEELSKYLIAQVEGEI
ncbi:MAG: hypothetical protein ABIC68_04415 [Candidatus Omnitrophota bacterium]